MYAGLTMLQDGAALTDQGSIAACQFTLPSERFNVSFENSTPKWVGVDHVESFYSDSVPTFNQTVNTSTCYQGPSKAGVYMPLRLTEDAMRWKSWRDCIRLGPDQHGYLYPNGQVQIPTTTNTTTFPFYGYEAYWVLANGSATGGGVFPPLDQTTCGVVSWQNVSVNTTFTLHFRYGYEFRVLLGSRYSPLAVPSPSYDPIALNTYFEISRKLKDAYPSEYNSLGKLWTVIKTALKGASALPSWPGALASGLSAAAEVVDSIVNSGKGDEPTKVVRMVKAPPIVRRVVTKQQRPPTNKKGNKKKNKK